MIGRLLAALAHLALGLLALWIAPVVLRIDPEHGRLWLGVMAFLWLARAWRLTRPRRTPEDQVDELLKALLRRISR